MSIEDFIGLPYKQYDCYQFVRYVGAEEFGIDYPCVYGYLSNSDEAVKDQRPIWEELDDPEEGCVVLMSHLAETAFHVGIYMQDCVLHSTHKLGSIAQTIRQLERSGYEIEGFYAWQG